MAKALKGVVPKDRVRFFEEIDSTNRLAKELAVGGAPAQTLVVADHQTKGRGRLDRTWESPPGANLMFSLVLRPDLEPGKAFSLTMAAGLGLARAVNRWTGLSPLLKWPNDLFLDGKKLAGILTELKVARGKVEWAVIGVGLNVSAHPPEMEAVDLAESLGRPVDRAALLREFMIESVRCSALPPGELRREWTELSCTLGRKVVVRDNGERVSGLAQGIDPEGALLLETETGLRRIVCGDLMVEGG